MNFDLWRNGRLSQQRLRGHRADAFMSEDKATGRRRVSDLERRPFLSVFSVLLLG
jgi:hypothetical protein